ncbi:hypothetical protein BH23ACT9_BH23ACT9_00500 [soil metagenome]
MPPTIVEPDAPDGAVDPQVPGAWPDPARRYLANVAEALDGIDAQEREDLLDDLRTHIAALLEVDSLDGRHPPLNLIVGLVYGSVEVGVGRRVPASRAWSVALRVSSLVAVFALLATLGSVRGVDNPDQFTVNDELYQELDYYRNQLGAIGSGLTLPGGEVVTNSYPYDRDGQPLDGVLLYDGVGNPLVLQPYPEGYGAPFADYGLQPDFATDATGTLVPNLYPLSQYRTGGQGVDGGLVGVDQPPGAQTRQTPSVRPRPEVAVPPGLDG